jgi:hypothetical protein
MERTCKKARKHLFAYLNLQLEQKKAKEIEGHMARCPLCRKEAEELQATWNLLGSHSIDRDFPDLMPGILEKMDRADKKYSIFQPIADLLFRVPAPALCLLMLILAIPPGTLLGKNLYFTFNNPKNNYLQETYMTPSEELPLHIFADFPEQSLGTIYMNLVPTPSGEES